MSEIKYINKFFENDFTIKVNAKSGRRFDCSTVIFKFSVQLFYYYYYLNTCHLN